MFEKNSHNDFSFTLTMRQLSLAVAALVAVSFFIFIAGYFLGQKRAAQDFIYRADQDSLADQIYSSMCVLYDPKEEEESENGDESEVSETESAVESIEVAEVKDDIVQETIIEPVIEQKKYKAVLSGFPATHLADAKQLIVRLKSKGYPAELVEHTSMHKKVSKKWYQVIVKASSEEYLEKSKSQFAKIGFIKEQSINIEPCA